ncbi:hypothetical protein QFC21_001266 [Naganishia friedmannii]|uniref:Uncharacterized protein n=1 Tax=Naganishia friedmannii TaxID=89922 RepID=A0ACC2W4K1_9TREE|nr:hypothetical protein QFC21_001266 [Naganishia friedmannii]
MSQSLQALSKEELIERLVRLEAKLGTSLEKEAKTVESVPTIFKPLTNGIATMLRDDSAQQQKPLYVKKDPRIPIFHRNPTRKIALLFTYQGWHYSGLALQNMPTPLPTVEGELLAALEKTHLIEQGAGQEGCGFSRCGRTDRGVSSAGQVVSLWVRSKRKPDDGGVELGDDWRPAREPNNPQPIETAEDPADANEVDALSAKVDEVEIAAATTVPKRARRSRPALASKTQPYENNYPQMLNRVLPPEIRVIGWSPLPTHSEFDARFSCQTRHYRYFFNRTPIPGQRPLNMVKMQEAADRLLGEHDFRNFCKVDGSKQIENHCRRVHSAVVRRDTLGETDIVGGTRPTNQQTELISENNNAGQHEDWVFELIGSAFLWHQVRHIMAILFLVGHELEEPSIVSKLLNTGYEPPLYPSVLDKTILVQIPLDPIRTEEDGVTEIVLRKPLFSMASGLPLQLYRCIYKEGDVDWRHGSYDGPVASRRGPAANDPLSEAELAAATEGTGNLLQIMKNQLEEAKIQTRHIQAFYDEAVERIHPHGIPIAKQAAQAHTLGAGDVMACKKYVGLMVRLRSEPVEEINRKWREGRGEKRKARLAAMGAVVGPDGE